MKRNEFLWLANMIVFGLFIFIILFNVIKLDYIVYGKAQLVSLMWVFVNLLMFSVASIRFFEIRNKQKTVGGLG